MKLIGLVGEAGSGKDTVADMLVKNHGFVKIGLADPMKRFLMELYGLSYEHLWGPSHLRGTPLKLDGKAISIRKALQELGTEWGRACDQDMWVDYCMRMVRHIYLGANYYPPVGVNFDFWGASKGVVISDVRFTNEGEGISLANGLVTLVSRLSLSVLSEEEAGHSSEKDLTGVVYHNVIYNNGSLEELEAEVALLAANCPSTYKAD